MMEKKPTEVRGVYLLFEPHLNCYVALEKNHGREIWRLYEDVIVEADVRGKIDIGISKPGRAKIMAFKEDVTDRWVGVLTEFGEFGWVKTLRLRKVSEFKTFLK